MSSSPSSAGTVLVTGGAGFIGSHLVDGLLARGYSVRVLDDFSTGSAENLAHVDDRIELIRGSILDAEAVRRAVAGCVGVLHEAAIASVARSVDDPVGVNQVNVGGTIGVLTAARDAGVRHFVYAASAAAYGNSTRLPLQEGELPDPLSPYAVTKLAGEQYCRVFHRLFGMQTVALRYFNVFGPRQSLASRYASVIPAFVTAALSGEPIPLEGDGTQSRDFVYVGDVVRANLLALETPSAGGEILNIGEGRRTDLNLLIRRLGELSGREPRVERGPARPGDITHSVADVSRAAQVLGYRPETGFAEGLRQTVEWFRQQLETGSVGRRSGE
ncbi:MAG: SDR family oxidoreductase [Armatimonadota bacterium]